MVLPSLILTEVSIDDDKMNADRPILLLDRGPDDY